jgi:predicted transcriptional regulator
VNTGVLSNTGVLLVKEKMMKSVKFLKDLQNQTGMNDTQLGKLLGITQGAVGHYKNERRVMDDETAGKIAFELGIDPMQVVAAACIDRAEKTGQKSIWEVFMSRMAAPTASALLALVAVNLFLTPQNAEASTGAALKPTGTAEEFILCKINDAHAIGVQSKIVR